MLRSEYKPKVWVTDKDRELEEKAEYDPDIDIGLLMIKVASVGMVAVGFIGLGILIL